MNPLWIWPCLLLGWLLLAGPQRLAAQVDGEAPDTNAAASDTLAPAPADTSEVDSARAVLPDSAGKHSPDTLQRQDDDRDRPHTASEDSLQRAKSAKSKADTSFQLDSLPPVKPSTRRLRPEAFRWGERSYDSLSHELGQFHEWDEEDTLSQGFTQELGQVGKPYQQWIWGLPGRYWRSSHYRDPLTGRPDVYLRNPATEFPSYDTKTPFVSIDFAQSAEETQILRLEGSVNVSPFVNVSFFYRRRTSTGAYPLFTTDHYNIAFSGFFHDLKGNYQGRVVLGWNQLLDEMNGGILRTPETPFPELFNKDGATTNLQPSAKLNRWLRNAYTHHTYYLLNDSAQKFGILGGGKIEQYTRFFNAPNGGDSIDDPSEPFGRLFAEPGVNFREEVNPLTRAAWGGGLLKLSRGNLKWSNRFEYRFRHTAYDGPVTIDNEIANRLLLESRLRWKRPRWNARLNGRLHQTRSNRLPSVSGLRVGGRLGWSTREARVIDSSVIDTTNIRLQERRREPKIVTKRYDPIALRFRGQAEQVSPSLFQRYWEGATFRGDPGLDRQEKFHLRASVEFKGRPGSDKGLAYLPNKLQLGAGFTRLRGPIFYDTDGQVRQAAAGASLSYPFARVKFRQRLGHFYLENETRLLRQTRDGGPASLTGHLPELSGTADLFHRDRWFDQRATVRIGIRGHYHTRYDGHTIDPSTGVFRPLASPALAEVQSYARLDLYVSARIQRARAFVKWIHLNEGFIRAGNFTTPLYPMLQRSFSFGVVWRFHD